MHLFARLIKHLDFTFPAHVPDPILIHLLKGEWPVACASPVQALFLLLSCVPPDEWPAWVRGSHWIWTGSTTTGKRNPAPSTVRRMDRFEVRKQVMIPQAIVSVRGRSTQAHVLTYEAAYGPDESPDGMYRQLKHDDHLCPTTLCLNPLHWEPVRARKRRPRRDSKAIRVSFTADQEMDELVEAIETKLAKDKSRDFETFWNTHYAQGLYTRDEVKAAIRRIGGSAQRRLLREDPDGQRPTGAIA